MRHIAVLGLLLILLTGCSGTNRRASQSLASRPPTPAAPLVPPPASELASMTPRPALFEVERHVLNQIALTFDAGADAAAVPLLLQTLAEHHVHATFFLTGKFCEHFPQQCRAIAAAGMEIGNHSYSHPHFTKLSRAAILRQLEKGEEAIRKACGRGAKPLFRFPYGDSNWRTQKIVAQAGYQAVGWTIDSLDSVGKPKSEAFLAKRILRRMRPGYITLMHVSQVHSAQALEPIFSRLDRMGVQVVPVSRLLIAYGQERERAAALRLARKSGSSHGSTPGSMRPSYFEKRGVGSAAVQSHRSLLPSRSATARRALDNGSRA